MPAKTPVARPEYQNTSGATSTTSKPRRTKSTVRLRVNRWACPAPSSTARRAIREHLRRLRHVGGYDRRARPLSGGPMLQDFTTNVTGALFLAGALMLWGAPALAPHRVGMF